MSKFTPALFFTEDQCNWNGETLPNVIEILHNGSRTLALK
jgi:hypothetical protein